MYKVIKSKGLSANVIVENTSSKSTVNIGRISIKIMHILEGAGIDISGKQSDEWDYEVNKEVATALAKLSLPMNKPIRDQRKPETKKQANKQIDAMDVMLGLANYS